eukprot:g7540.t1
MWMFSCLLLGPILAQGEDPSVANGELTPPDLPFPPMPSKAVVGPTLADSVNSWPPKRKPLKEDAPNILLIMNDDVGYGAPETFGGPIHTPTLSKVARHWCLHTWCTIPKSAATLAKVLSGYGYDTAAFGKWHNTPVDDLMKSGPFDQYPTGLGFSYFYGFLAGETSQYNPRLYENTNPIEPPRKPEEGYHLTEDMADQAIKFIRANRALTPDRPFFIYFAPGGAHGPHHVHKEWADKYKGKFDMGWEKLRNITFEKQKAMGWIPNSTKLTPIDPTMVKWEEIPDARWHRWRVQYGSRCKNYWFSRLRPKEEQRAFQLRLMEVYAGYLEHTDTQESWRADEWIHMWPKWFGYGLTFQKFCTSSPSPEPYRMRPSGSRVAGRPHVLLVEDGKVVEELERQGLFNNTLIIYVLGDNGASAEGIHGTIDELLAENALPSTYQQQMEVLNRDFGGLDALGSQHDKMYHSSWAWALDTPFKSTKLVAAHFGGMRTPMVMSWPKAKKWKKGSTEKVIKHDPTPRVYKDGWFASVFGPRIPWAEANETRMREWNPDTDVWELYDLTRDFSQAEDLAKEMPDQVAKMKQIFLMEATANKVLPIGAGLYTIYYHPEEGPHSPLTEWKLYEGLTRIAESNAPGFHSGQNSLATIDVEISANASGVLYCVGGTAGGFSVYMDNGYLYAEYMSTLLYRYIAKSTTPLQPGTRKIQVRLIFETTKGLGPPVDLTLFVDGQQVGWVKVEKSIRLVFDASETFDVGMDLGSPVSLLYQNRTPFKFNGKINLLHVKYINGMNCGLWNLVLK